VGDPPAGLAEQPHVVLAKVLAFALVLGIVPVALLAFGGLPAEPRKDLVASEVRQVNSEQQWHDRVGAICGWQRKQVKLFKKAFRDVAIEFQRESRTLVRLLESESASLGAMAKAFHDQRRDAFVRSLRRFIRLDARSSALLNDLGGAGCGAKPITLPESQRVRIV
jgi:hypothetical protein